MWQPKGILGDVNNGSGPTEQIRKAIIFDGLQLSCGKKKTKLRKK